MAPLNEPGCQVKKAAPEALRLTLLPTQTEAEAGVMLIEGRGNTLSVKVATVVQPLALVPVTEYTVVTVGFTTMFAPVPPVDQT